MKARSPTRLTGSLNSFSARTTNHKHSSKATQFPGTLTRGESIRFSESSCRTEETVKNQLTWLLGCATRSQHGLGINLTAAQARRRIGVALISFSLLRNTQDIATSFFFLPHPPWIHQVRFPHRPPQSPALLATPPNRNLGNPGHSDPQLNARGKRMKGLQRHWEHPDMAWLRTP